MCCLTGTSFRAALRASSRSMVAMMGFVAMIGLTLLRFFFTPTPANHLPSRDDVIASGAMFSTDTAMDAVEKG